MRTEQVQLNLLSLAAIVIKADGKVLIENCGLCGIILLPITGKNTSSIFTKFNNEVKKRSKT